MDQRINQLLTTMDEKSNHQQNQITQLLEAIHRMPGIQGPINVQVQPAPQDPAIIRADKLQRLTVGLRKGGRIKEFKHNKDSNIRMYIKKFDEEIKSLKCMVGINDELTQSEYIPLLRGNLEYSVIKRVEQVFKSNPNNLRTWELISIVDLHNIMIEEFCIKYTDVASVLGQFGPSRLSKSADKTVSEFYYEWLVQIPDIMKPTTDAEFKNFTDLVHRAMFYISLNDTFLQQALSDLKEPNPTLKSYLDEAIAAESRRKCFNDIAVSSSTLDSSGGVVISKWDASYLDNKKQYYKDSKSKGAKPKKGNEPTNSKNAEAKNPKSNQNSNQNSNHQNPHKNQNQNSTSRYCSHCKLKSHWTNDCRKLKAKREKSHNKQINNVEANYDSDDQQNCQSLHDDFGTFSSKALCAVDSRNVVIDTFATKITSHPLVTNAPLMAILNLEDVVSLKLEVDTAASHNIISQSCYEVLQANLKKQGKEKSKSLPKGVKIKLADGSIASQECKVIQINVSRDLTNFRDNIPLTFLVVAGPNNLIGRHSLELLWPKEFQAFKNVTGRNVCQPKVSQHTEEPATNSSNIHYGTAASKCKRKNSTSKSNNETIQSRGPNRLGNESWEPGSEDVIKHKNVNSNSNSVSSRPVGANIFPRENPHLPPAPSPTPSQTPPPLPQRVRTTRRVRTGKSDDVIWPDRRPLPQMPPDEEVTQEIGNAFCKKLCAVYPEVFDGGKGEFLGAEAVMLLKPGGLEKIRRTGFRPAAKVPYGLEDQYDTHLDALYEDLEIIDGKDIFTASQIVPVIETIDGVRVLKRLTVNYKPTVNEHLLDIPDNFYYVYRGTQ